MYQPGDWVIFLADKYSDHPGRGAEGVQPEPHGEGYRYRVKKYWTVTSVDADSLEVITRRGKRRRLSPTDLHLRAAYWWEKLFLAGRFPAVDAPEDAPAAKAG